MMTVRAGIVKGCDPSRDPSCSPSCGPSLWAFASMADVAADTGVGRYTSSQIAAKTIVRSLLRLRSAQLWGTRATFKTNGYSAMMAALACEAHAVALARKETPSA